MDVARLPALYTEKIPLLHLAPGQYLALAQKAAEQLHWLTVAINSTTIICHTPGSEQSAGEIVAIAIEGRNAIISSKPANEYFADTEAHARNAQLFRQSISRVIEEADKNHRNLHPMHREKYGALIPSKSYLVTPLLVYANTLVFAAMLLGGLSFLHPSAQSLFEWGGNFRQAVTAGEWWRLLTYMFLHGGAMHLLANTFALLYIGMFLEPLMGRFRFAAAYLFTGVCAGLLSITMHSFSVGVGASGAIFGMYGVFLSMLTTTHIQKTLRKTMLRSILFFVVFNLMSGLQGNTDNAAHIGGLLSGIAIGYVYYPGIAKHSPISRQLVTTGIIAAVTLLLSVVTIAYLKG